MVTRVVGAVTQGQFLMDCTLLMRCSLVVFFLPSTPVPADETADTQAAPAWTDQVQTYSMLPLLPDTAKKMHVSVNGIWAGISSDHPLLPSREMIPSVRKRYGNDVAAFVKDSHEARLIVCGIVNGIEGMESLREKYPNLEAMACRDAEGKPARNDAWLLMCTNNPD